MIATLKRYYLNRYLKSVGLVGKKKFKTIEFDSSQQFVSFHHFWYYFRSTSCSFDQEKSTRYAQKLSSTDDITTIVVKNDVNMTKSWHFDQSLFLSRVVHIRLAFKRSEYKFR